MATYVNDLRLKEIATGDEAGTWGTSTNTNLELIAEAFSFGTEAITTNANTHTTTIADGSTDPGRSIFLKYTGALDSDCTITIGPNTISKLWLIENATTDSGSSGPYNIIIKQGTGATVTIPNSHTKAIYSDGAGSGGAMVEAFTDLNLTDTVTISGSTPTLTIGDAGEEDTKIVFDGNAQDFYIGLDDSADDLVIGKGTSVGTTPAIEIDENLDIKFAESIGVGQAASSTTGDIVAQTMSLKGTTPTLTIGDAGAEDTKIVFDGNAQDFYIALDDSADDLLIGLGSSVGTTPAIAVDENLLTTLHGGLTMVGTTPTLTIGDAGAEDTKIVFDGNAQDYYIGLDDSADDLLIGLGSSVGTTPAISIDENLKSLFGGDVEVGTTSPKINLKNTDTSIVADQSLGVIEIESTDGSTGSAGTIAKLDIVASGAFDGSGHGSQYRFSTGATNQSGSIALTEQMRLSDVGNLHLSGGSDRRIQLGNGGAGANQVSNNTVHIRADGTNMKLMTASGGSYVFEQNGTQALEIDSSGRYGFNSTYPPTSAQFMRIEEELSSNRVMRISNRDNGAGGKTMEIGHADNNQGASIITAFHGNNVSGASGDPFLDAVFDLQVSGSISIDGTLSEGSDRRLKKDIANSTYGLAAINQLIPRTYKHRDVSKEMIGTQIGFIADEVESVIPEVVSKFGLKADGSTLSKIITGYGDEAGVEETFDNVKTLNYERLVVVLTKALQEADDKIDALTSRVTTLEGA
jgi:hypothetical protein